MIPELARGLAQTSRSVQPLRWLNVAALPPLVVGGQVLETAQVLAFLEALRQSSSMQPHPVVRLVRYHADPASLRAFLWQLVAQWELSRVSGRWIFEALSLFGDDDLVRELAARVLAWREQGNYHRVTLGLECLAAMGFDSALRALNAFAQQERYKAVQNRAIAHLERIAATRQLSRRQLEDRIVPRFGLEDSAAAFGFGRRRFFVTLNDQLALVLCDERGNLLRSLPKPTRNETAECVAHARERWKALRKDITQEIRVQSARFERAMVDRYRWDSIDWEQAILGHPLLVALARRVLWAGYDANGALLDVFCLAEDLSASNERYTTIRPRDFAAIGIPHPADVPLERRLAWIELLQEFQIMPLFPQLSRPVYNLAAVGSEQTAITHFAATHLKLGTTRQLYRQHWRSGGYEDMGKVGFSMFSIIRRFEGANITAVARYRSARDHELCEECFFFYGLLAKYRHEDQHMPIALGDVPAIVLSETIRDWIDLVNNPKYHYEG